MATAGVLGLVATVVVGTASVAASSATGTLYFTCYGNQGGTSPGNCTAGSTAATVQKAVYQFNGSTFTVSSATTVANPPGADGAVFAPNGDLLVAGQSATKVEIGGNPVPGDVYEINPTTGRVVAAVTSGIKEVDHLSLDPSGKYLWAGGYETGLARIQLSAFTATGGSGRSCTITSSAASAPADQYVNTIEWVGTQPYYTASNPGNLFGGYGNFGTITLDYKSGSCTVVVDPLLQNFAAAHGMSYDPANSSLILYGSNMIAQVDPSTVKVIAEIGFGQSCTTGISASNCLHLHSSPPSSTSGANQFDQGAVDSLGNIFVADNNGDLVVVPSTGSQPISTVAPGSIYDHFLTKNLDDLVPQSGSGAFPISTQQSPTTVVAGATATLQDTATVSSPAGGQVSFSLYGPTSSANPVCSSDLVTGSTQEVSLSGSQAGPAKVTLNVSSAVPTAATNAYEWQATYTWPSGGPTVSTPCGSEPVNIIAAPTISTTLVPASPITVGTVVHDTATLTDATSTAGGTVTYQYYATAGCTATGVAAGKVTVTSGDVPNSNSVSFATAGSYSWNATYAGDANNQGATSPCEPLMVASLPPPPPPPTPNTPNITTVPSAGGPVGTHLSDTAHVTGIVSPGTSDNLSFALYSDPSCTTLVDNLGSVSLAGPATTNGVATWTAASPGTGYAPTVAGTYYWGVTFNSINDSANLSSSLVCGEPVTITPSGGTLGAHTTPTPTPTPTPAGAVKAASTPTPNTGADLFLSGALAALAILLGGLLLLTAARLRAYPRV
ncbi:MAG: hypothetical protein ACYCYK_10740 [Candidatus Dormibacteria bacterium]